MTLSLNPNITEQDKEQREIKLENTDIIANSPTLTMSENDEKTSNLQENQTPPKEAQNQTETNLNTESKQISDGMLENTFFNSIRKSVEEQRERTMSEAQNETENEKNPLLDNKEYQEFIKTKIKDRQRAQQAINIQNLKDDSFLPEWSQKLGIALMDSYVDSKYGIDAPKYFLDSWQKQGDSAKEVETTIYDYIAKYGEDEARKLGLKKIDEDLLEKAKTRQEIMKKEASELNEKEKDYLRGEQTIAGRLWDKTFNDEGKNIAEYQRNETRKNINAKLVNQLVELHSISTSIMDLTNSDEENAKQKDQFLREGSQLAKNYGYDALVYDKKAKQYALIKEGKKYYPDIEGVFRNLDKSLVNNYYDTLLTSASLAAAPFTGGTSAAAGLAAREALKQGAKYTLMKEAGKVGALSLAGSTIDYVENSKDLNRDVKAGDLARYAVGNALTNAGGTLVIGGAFKALGKGADLVKDIKSFDTNNIKVKNFLDNEEMAINRKLAKFDKKELDSNYENFKKIQSDNVILKDIREGGILESFMDKVNQYNPLEKFTSKKETQERLLSSIFSNKELGREFAGQLTSEEAQIVNKAVAKLGDNFKRLSKEYEDDLLNEYVKSGKTHIESVPALYKELLNEIDNEAKLRYTKSIRNLHENLNETDFKSPLLQGYKNITDKAIDSLGFENDLTRTLIRETQKLENKPSINLSEAIELRKDINEILRNYEKSSSDLKKFRAKEHLESMKANIDGTIKNALDSKVAKGKTTTNLGGTQKGEATTNMGGTRGLGRENIKETNLENGRVQGEGAQKNINTNEATTDLGGTPKGNEALGRENLNTEAKATNLHETQKGQNLTAKEAQNTEKIQNEAGQNPQTQILTQKEADELFNEFMNANANYAKIKESLKDKFSQAMTKGMNKKDLDSRLTTEQWKKRVLDTDWGESVKGLENTIFKNFNPKMQERTQMLLIFRALDRNINALNDSKVINMGKILQDLEKLENLTLAPKVRGVLDLFKKYANCYQFAEEMGRAKGLEMMHGGGAMATTLSGRMQVFMTNRLFKKVFAYIPYLGDNNAILKSLSKAIKNLKYPSEITLETLKNLKEADLQRGFKPNPSNNKIPLNEIAETTPKTDKELQEAIRNKGRILDQKSQNELETLATNPHLLKLENTYKYESQTKNRKDLFLGNLEQTKKDLREGNFVAKEGIKQDRELIDLIENRLESHTAYTPDQVAMHLEYKGNNYAFIQDKHEINYIYELPKEKNPPKTYDELMAKERAESAELESYKAQTQDILERKIQGKDFVMTDDGKKPKTDYNVSFELSPNVRDLANLKDEHIRADLEHLANKHREMFKKPSDVFRLLKEIKDNPEFFYKNNRLDASLIVKRLNNEKIGKMVVRQDDGQVVHATKVKDKDLDRLKRVSDDLSGNVGIIQTFTQQGSKNSQIKELNGLPNNLDTTITKAKNQEILLNISQKTQELQKLNEKIAMQTTQKGKKYFTDRKNTLENELQDLEIQAGLRTSKTKPTTNRQDIKDTEYTLTTKDNEKIILTEAEKKELTDRLKMRSLTELKQISNGVSKMLDSKLILDLPKYMKSVDIKKAREIKELENTLYNYDIALRDSDNIYLMAKDGEKYFTLKATKENGDYYIRGDKNLTENEIIDKVKSGSEVLASNNPNIKSEYKVIQKGESIPFTKLRETSLQTEKMKEAIKADYVVIKKQHLKPNFTSEDGLQYRNQRQDNVIKDIQENLNVNKLVNQEGGFQGLPLIQHDGQIIAGNHRGQALQGLNEISRKNYEKAIKDRFNIDLKSDEIVVRRINDSVDKEKILQLAKASNEGLENSLQEAIYTKLAKYEQHIKEIKDLHSQNLEAMKQEVNTKLKGGPTDIGETNLALLTAQVKDTKSFIHALNTMEKKPAFQKMYNMMVDNAGSFYVLNKKYPDLNTGELLQGSLNVLALAKEDTRDIFKNLADEFALYLKSSNREAIQEQRKMMGLNPDPIKDFKSEILGATLKRYTINNTNPSEHLFEKIKSFQELAEDMKGAQLFGEAHEINDTLFITHLYSNVGDTSRDISFLLKVADTMEKLENKKITMQNISDSHVKEFIEKLPKQKSETKQRTIDFIDNYTKLKAFQELPQNKQEAILKLKEIKPALMPESLSELKGDDMQNIIKHFADKQDKASREFYLKLLNDTKENADIILSTEGKQGEDRKAYIKAYQHKATHDLYYFLVTQDNDKINITSYPITEIKEVIRRIRQSKEVIR